MKIANYLKTGYWWGKKLRKDDLRIFVDKSEVRS